MPTSPPGVTRNATATKLLARARDVAIAAFEGQGASPEMLSAFARRVRTEVLAQAMSGDWEPLGIRRIEQLSGLRVASDVETSLVRGKKIRIRYDFTDTAIPHLVVDQL